MDPLKKEGTKSLEVQLRKEGGQITGPVLGRGLFSDTKGGGQAKGGKFN